MLAFKLWLRRTLAVGAAAALSAGSASAQTRLWTGNSGDNWTNAPLSWNGGPFPDGVGQVASFTDSGTAGPSTVVVNGTFTVGGLTFGPGGLNVVPAWTLSPSAAGNSLTLNNTGGTAAAINVQTGTTATLNVNTTGVGFTKSGPNTLTLNGTNVYTGTSSVSASSGTLQIGSGTTNGSFSGTLSIGTGSTVQVGTGGTGGTISGNISNAGTLAFNKVGSTDTYSGSLSGAGALTKTGISTLVFTGTSNTFSGNTTLNANAGTVRVSAGATLGQSGAQTVSVGAGTALGGEGTIGGAVTYAAATSALFVGDGTAGDTGTLTFSNTLNFSTGASTFDFNDNLAATAGVGYDAVTVGGAVTLGGTFTAAVNDTGSVDYTNTSMRIINGGSLTGAFSNFAQGDIITALNGFGGVAQWFMNYDAPNGDVYITPVPEPASVIGVAAAGLGLARWVRRRKAGVMPSAGPEGPRPA